MIGYGYFDKLATIPPENRRALLLGNWRLPDDELPRPGDPPADADQRCSDDCPICGDGQERRTRETG